MSTISNNIGSISRYCCGRDSNINYAQKQISDNTQKSLNKSKFLSLIGGKLSKNKAFDHKFILAVIFVFLLTGCNMVSMLDRPEKVIYVKQSNSGLQTGESWKTAFTSVQDALNNSSAGDQIWIAKGIYFPTDDSDRAIHFQMVEGVAMFGGFQGYETDLSQRDWVKYKTILSGNIGDKSTNDDNSYTVIYGADDAIIDGFTISDGRSDDVGPGNMSKTDDTGSEGRMKTHSSPEEVFSKPKPGIGGGMMNFKAAPIVRNCIIKNNRAGKGGGVYNMVAQRAMAHGGSTDKYPIFINVTIENNYASVRGGGVSNDLATSPIFIDSRIINNVCDDKGAGMYNDFTSSPYIENSLFAGNEAIYAAAMGNDGSSKPIIVQSTIAYNKATEFGAGLYQGSGPSNRPTVSRSILWGNKTTSDANDVYDWHESYTTISNSIVQDGFTGENNRTDDPKFVDPQNFDFSLKPESPIVNEKIGYNPAIVGKDTHNRYETIIDNAKNLIQSLEIVSVRHSVPSLTASLDMDIKKTNIVYVKPEQSSQEDGLSWDTAFSDLQTAIDYAFLAKGEVWVQEGVYYPDASIAGRSASFQLRKNVALYGGFDGNETTRDEREVDASKTILSGDIGLKGIRTDNVYHVLRGADNATVDGFTITSGYADGAISNGSGGGLLNYYPEFNMTMTASSGYSPKFENCVFSNNYAKSGGAIYSYHKSTPVFTNCTFVSNEANWGAVSIERVGVTAKYVNSKFINNKAKYKGGVTFVDYGANPIFTNSIFQENEAGTNGGCLYFASRGSQLDNTMGKVENSTFSNNKAGIQGGALYIMDKSYITLSNTRFEDNESSEAGAGIYLGFDSTLYSSGNTFKNNEAKEGEDNIDVHPTATILRR